MTADGGPDASQREMLVNAILARLRNDAPEPLSETTVEMLRSEVIPAYVAAREDYIAGKLKLEEQKLEVEAQIEARLSGTPEGERIEAAKQALDDSPQVQAAKAKLEEALALAEVAAMVDPQTAETMAMDAQLKFQAEVEDLPQARELEAAVHDAQHIVGKEVMRANLALGRGVREVRQARSRVKTTRDAMFKVAGIAGPGVDSGGQGREVA